MAIRSRRRAVAAWCLLLGGARAGRVAVILNGLIRFCGRERVAELAELLRGASVFACVSSASEPSALALLVAELEARGTPLARAARVASAEVDAGRDHHRFQWDRYAECWADVAAAHAAAPFDAVARWRTDLFAPFPEAALLPPPLRELRVGRGGEGVVFALSDYVFFGTFDAMATLATLADAPCAARPRCCALNYSAVLRSDLLFPAKFQWVPWHADASADCVPAVCVRECMRSFRYAEAGVCVKRTIVDHWFALARGARDPACEDADGGDGGGGGGTGGGFFRSEPVFLMHLWRHGIAVRQPRFYVTIDPARYPNRTKDTHAARKAVARFEREHYRQARSPAIANQLGAIAVPGGGRAARAAERKRAEQARQAEALARAQKQREAARRRFQPGLRSARREQFQ